MKAKIGPGAGGYCDRNPTKQRANGIRSHDEAPLKLRYPTDLSKLIKKGKQCGA